MTNLQKPTWYACYTEGLNSDVSFVRTYEEAVALIDWNISDDPSLSFDNLVTPLYLHPPQPQATTPVPLPLDRNISQHEINVLNSVQYVLEVALNPPSHTQWLADRAEIIEEVKLLLANNKAQGEKP